ncbi:MAG: hypothetical protein QME46_11670, partial [Thermoanaerobacteraceae bacterium]|nr:hypothetical protein [Thermoanaerobacteraceae bacterium]
FQHFIFIFIWFYLLNSGYNILLLMVQLRIVANNDILSFTISYQVLLEMRYISGKSWDDVASVMGYDRRTIFKIHGKALKEIEKIKSCH